MSKTATGPVPTERERSLGRRIGAIAFGIVAGLIVLALIGVGLVTYTVQRSFPQVSGELALEGLEDEVTVQRDGLGIPVITADGSHDLFYAQGYVHAQDRFWEMDFRRHVTSGRVAELFGESQLAGEVTLPGLGAAVTVYRDARGIPQIYADTPADLLKAQGYVHAQDRFWEMDFRRHVTSGRVAELFGESQLATDEFLRTLGWREVAEQEVEALDESVRGYYDAYAEGVNAYLADHKGAAASLEYAVLGLQNPD